MNPQAILADLKGLGRALRAVEQDTSQRVTAREPHVAHYADLNPVMFPESLRTVEELVAFCRKQSIKYVVYSGVEYSSRPYLRILFKPEADFQGLEHIISNRAGIVYRVTGI